MHLIRQIKVAAGLKFDVLDPRLRFVYPQHLVSLGRHGREIGVDHHDAVRMRTGICKNLSHAAGSSSSNLRIVASNGLLILAFLSHGPDGTAAGPNVTVLSRHAHILSQGESCRDGMTLSGMPPLPTRMFQTERTRA